MRSKGSQSYGPLHGFFDNPLRSPQFGQVLDTNCDFNDSKYQLFSISFSERCPTPMESPEPTTSTTTEETFNEENDISNKARADRSYDSKTESSAESWSPRTVVYTLPPEPGSQTSSAHTLSDSKLTKIIFNSLMTLLFAKYA